MAKHQGQNPDWSAPATSGTAVTPADADILPTRALWIGGAGNVSVIFTDDSSPVTLSAVPAGTLLPMSVRQVRSTGTTATLIVALR